MKILHIGNTSNVGYKLCAELRSRGFEADLITKRKFIFESTFNEPWIKYANNLIDKINHLSINLNDYDIIHAHYLINWSSLGLRLKNVKKPVILHCHGSDTRPHTFLHKIIQRYVATKSKTLIYSSPDLENNIKWFSGETCFLPNPILIPDEISQQEKHKNRILIYTTLYKMKQTQDIFALLSKLDYNFDIIGWGPDMDYFRRISPSNINFIKPIEPKNINSTLLKYSLIIGGSQDGTIRQCELEPMSLGIPTLFPFKYNSFYENPLPMPGFSAKNIIKSFGDYNLGKAQKQWVQENHGAGIIADKLIKIYSSI